MAILSGGHAHNARSIIFNCFKVSSNHAHYAHGLHSANVNVCDLSFIPHGANGDGYDHLGKHVCYFLIDVPFSAFLIVKRLVHQSFNQLKGLHCRCVGGLHDFLNESGFSSYLAYPCMITLICDCGHGASDANANASDANVSHADAIHGHGSRGH